MYCLYIILHTVIIGLIIFLKPGLEPGFGLSHVVSTAQAQSKPGRWVGLGSNGPGLGGLWAWPSTSLTSASHQENQHLT